MPTSARRLCAAAAGSLALATCIGALGAHLLQPRLPPGRYAILQTAVHYQFFHSLGLLALGVLQRPVPARMLRTAGRLLLAGVMLFSGSLYALLAGAPRWLGIATPAGGVCLIVAWSLAAWSLGRHSQGRSADG